MIKRTRVGILTSHPIQYQVPLFKWLSANSWIEPVVIYITDWGVEESFDPGFGRSIRFDISLLDGYEYHFVPKHGFPVTIGTKLGVFNFSTTTTLSHLKLDALLIHGYTNPSSLLAYLTAMYLRIPYFIRGDSQPDIPSIGKIKLIIKSLILRPLIRRSSGCLAIGTRNAQFYRDYGAASEQIFFVPFSVDTERFELDGLYGREHRSEMLSSIGLDPDLPTIIFAAKFLPHKRPLDLIAAIEVLEQPVNLLLIGDGLLRDQIQSRLAEIPRAEMVGFVNQSQIGRWFGAADLIVLPSEYEPWGLVINEAMAAGAVPIVSLACGCATDLVAGGVGWIFATGDVELLCEAIREACAQGISPGRRMRSIERSRQYGIVQTAHGIEDALEVLVGRRD